MKQFKTCKGQNKAYGFSSCGNQVPAKSRTYGLCRKCYNKWLLTTPEGQQKMQSAILKASKPRRDLEKAEKENKQYNKLESLKNSVKTICHSFIKLRDKYKSCISCGTSWNKDFQAGHYYKAEKYSTIKFHENNIHGQCRKCNLRKDGNFDEYKLNLPNRIGQEAFDEIEYLASLEKKSNFKWERSKLEALRTYYRTKLKQLKTQIS